jgi:hypothetical protein
MATKKELLQDLAKNKKIKIGDFVDWAASKGIELKPTWGWDKIIEVVAPKRAISKAALETFLAQRLGSWEELRKLLNLREDALYAILGYQSLGLDETVEQLTYVGLADKFSISRDELIARGKVFFKDFQGQLKTIICDEWHYCNKKGDYVGDVMSLMDVLVPVVVASISLPESLADSASDRISPLIAILIVLAFTYGFDRLCGCKTPPEDYLSYLHKLK